jgi:hypothetical protein
MASSTLRTRVAALVTSGVIAVGGVGAVGCGDDDNEGPVEEAGKVIDEGADEVGEAAEKGAKELDKEVDVDVDADDDKQGKKGGKKGDGN